MPPHELAQPVPARRGADLDRLVGEVAPDVVGQGPDRGVAFVGRLREGLHHDRVEVAAQLAAAIAWSDFTRARRHVATHDVGEAAVALRHQHRARDRQLVRQQLVQLHAQRIDVGAGVQVGDVATGLLRAHELRCAHQVALQRHGAAIEQRARQRLGDAEVDDLGLRVAVGIGDQHVVRAQVAVHHGLLVGVLHRIEHPQEQLQPGPQWQVAPAAMCDQRRPVDQLHDEERPPAGRGAGVEQPRDAGVVHPVQRFALGAEARQDVARVHARVEHLDRDFALDRLLLLGAVDRAEAAAAEQFGQHVVAELQRQRLGIVGGSGFAAAGDDTWHGDTGGTEPGAQGGGVLRPGREQGPQRRRPHCLVAFEDGEHRLFELLGQVARIALARTHRRGIMSAPRRRGHRRGASRGARHFDPEPAAVLAVAVAGGAVVRIVRAQRLGHTRGELLGGAVADEAGGQQRDRQQRAEAVRGAAVEPRQRHRRGDIVGGPGRRCVALIAQGAGGPADPHAVLLADFRRELWRLLAAHVDRCGGALAADGSRQGAEQPLGQGVAGGLGAIELGQLGRRYRTIGQRLPRRGGLAARRDRQQRQDGERERAGAAA
jgi:hypothetical protein